MRHGNHHSRLLIALLRFRSSHADAGPGLKPSGKGCWRATALPSHHSSQASAAERRQKSCRCGSHREVARQCQAKPKKPRLDASKSGKEGRLGQNDRSSKSAASNKLASEPPRTSTIRRRRNNASSCRFRATQHPGSQSEHITTVWLSAPGVLSQIHRTYSYLRKPEPGEERRSKCPVSCTAPATSAAAIGRSRMAQ